MIPIVYDLIFTLLYCNGIHMNDPIAVAMVGISWWILAGTHTYISFKNELAIEEHLQLIKELECQRNKINNLVNVINDQNL